MNQTIEWISGWTNNGSLAILLFIPLAFVLLMASIKLIKYAEVIIAKTRFGGAFIGGVLVAAVTSLPELITEIAQSSTGHPGAGSADDIGSNAFSAFLIVISLIIFYRATFITKISKFSKITIAISSLVSFVLSVLMFFNKDISIGSNWVIGLIPISLFIFYIVMLVVQYKFDKDDEEVIELDEKYQELSVRKAIALFSLFALIVALFALGVNLTATSMIEGWGLSEGGTGGILLAATTSLPEIVAYVIFLRKKRPTAAMASLIGSHFFNIGIAFFGDLAYGSDAIFNVNKVGDNWHIALITGIIMFLVFIQAIFSKKLNSKLFNIALPSIGAATYIVGWTLILVL
ncbi:MAG: hypothetical protein KAG14_01130 [Mycoplasmataceae bacterium]|nr:hypothetical protein [Mycoplasmataceae bacterium]